MGSRLSRLVPILPNLRSPVEGVASASPEAGSQLTQPQPPDRSCRAAPLPSPAGACHQAGAIKHQRRGKPGETGRDRGNASKRMGGAVADQLPALPRPIL